MENQIKVAQWVDAPVWHGNLAVRHSEWELLSERLFRSRWAVQSAVQLDTQ